MSGTAQEDTLSVEKETFVVTHNGIAMGVMSGCVMRELLRAASSFGTREETMHRFISLILTYSFYPISRPPYFAHHTQIIHDVFICMFL